MRKFLFAAPLLFVVFATTTEEQARADDKPMPTMQLPSPNGSRLVPMTIDPIGLSRAQANYFQGEFDQGYFWSGVGVASLVAGGVLFADDRDFARGVSYPLIAVGAVQTFIGVLSFARPHGRIMRNDEQIKKDPARWLEDERARVRTVNRFFGVVETLEVAAVATGISLGGAGLVSRDKSMQGVGLGIAIQGTLMFLLDAFAHARAERYEGMLRILSNGMPVP